MKNYRITTEYASQLADTTTPVSIYLKVRDKYPHALLLESSEHHSRENSFSYICCSPLAGIEVGHEGIVMDLPNETKNLPIADRGDVVNAMEEFIGAFDAEDNGAPYSSNGIFGYMNYEAVQYFEDIDLTAISVGHKNTPDLVYHLFRFVIVVDHYKNTLHIHRHHVNGFEDDGPSMSELMRLINMRSEPKYSFSKEGDEESNQSDDYFKSIVEKGKYHCRQGDVFQVVLSREFNQNFSGDEFNVYRALRSINPSPYLFYFDYGNYSIFGSSPEAQLTIHDNVARINPIAGTYKRTGIQKEDQLLAERLKNDRKENAEHIMLVDLARNDLSRNAANVTVDTFRDIHFYSHVIHMVSEVSGNVDSGNLVRIAADTFPAGTLSGAPKYRAMQLIDEYEPNRRGFYGGAIGFIGFQGEFNHAITIRSFLSKDNTLVYQAGAGVVVDSDSAKELAEVNNKFAALRSAIQMAEEL